MTKPYPKKVKYLRQDEAEQAIAEVVSAAARQDIHIALIGGIAMQAYGSDRLTVDVDFAAERDDSFGLKDLGPLGIGGTYGTASNGVRVDVVVRSDEFERLYWEACYYAPEFQGGPRVVAPEYLAVMKFEAKRAKDMLDLDFLIWNDLLDLVKVETILRRHLGPYAVKDFARFREESLWRLSKEKK